MPPPLPRQLPAEHLQRVQRTPYPPIFETHRRNSFFQSRIGYKLKIVEIGMGKKIEKMGYNKKNRKQGEPRPGHASGALVGYPHPPAPQTPMNSTTESRGRATGEPRAAALPQWILLLYVLHINMYCTFILAL